MELNADLRRSHTSWRRTARRGAAARAWRLAARAVVVVTGACDSGGTERSYVGTEHPPMPSGAEVLLGALADPAHAGAGPEYGITHVRLGGGERVWLDSLVGRVEAGRQPRWRVVDELRLPPMPAGHDLVAQLCSVGGVADYGVIAIARRDTAPVLADIRSAWRADLAARRFRSLAPDGVTCVNEGYGV